jgi:plasmid stabilization system protein ParE
VAYLVKIAGRAERDLAALYDEIDAEHSGSALRWYAGQNEAILGLEKHPALWPAIPESRGLRHLLYGRKPHRIYRVIYRIDERHKLIVVLHIRHGSSQQFNRRDAE